jgi:hypothetical protein
MGVSTSGTSNIIVQLGTAGGLEITGYLGAGGQTSSAASTVANGTTGFLIEGTVAAGNVIHGSMTISLGDPTTNTWVAATSLGRSDAALMGCAGGSKSLAAEVDRVRVTTIGGVTTFDLGKININYET